jgi:hypothetical protein
MKVYINNINIDILDDISNVFKEKLVDTKSYIELYTNEDIYIIEQKDIYVLNVLDKDIKIYEKYYKDFTLITDPSYFNKKNISSIHGEKHLSFKTKKKYYKMNNNSDVYLVIKHHYKSNCFIPVDIYFKIDGDIDINDILIKKEIIEFLSFLN